MADEIVNLVNVNTERIERLEQRTTQIAKRSLWVPASAMHVYSGSATFGYTASTLVGSIAMDGSTTEAALAEVDWPADWNSYDAYLWTVNTTGNSGNANVNVFLRHWVDGALVGGYVTTTNTQIDVTITGTTGIIERHQIITGVDCTGITGPVIALAARFGGDSGDTLTGDLGFHAIEFVQAS